MSNALTTKHYLRASDEFWFHKISPFIPYGHTLKIGNGNGYLSELTRPLSETLTLLDIQTYPETINAEKVTLYAGSRIPFDDKTFGTSILVFTLHHIPENTAYFQEVVRVTKNRIILLEETYTSIFQKIHLYYRDWCINTQGGQPCELFWNSYFSRKSLNQLIQTHNLTEVARITKPHKTYFKELLVLDLPKS